MEDRLKCQISPLVKYRQIHTTLTHCFDSFNQTSKHNPGFVISKLHLSPVTDRYRMSLLRCISL